jgi:hypothetical protein
MPRHMLGALHKVEGEVGSSADCQKSRYISLAQNE